MYAKSESTIANILNAAEELFLARSFASVSMRDIAEQVNMTKGALYHHFDSKEALYVAMMQRDLEAKRQMFAEAIEVDGNSRHRLRHLTERFLALPPLKRRLIQLVRRDINQFNGNIRKRIIDAYQAALPEKIEVVIQEGIQAGEIITGEPRLLAWSYIALVEVILTPYAESILSNPEEKLNHVLDLFFKGVQASGAGH